jgi:catechol 2,3-dioxygenase
MFPPPLPPLTQLTLGRVRLQVADLAASRAYYEGVLGLHPIGPISGGQVSTGTLLLGAPASAAGIPPLPLVELVERPGARPALQGGRPGLYHFALLLPDRAALGRFIVHLAELGVRFGAADHLVSEAVYLNDPDGLGIEVYSDRPSTGWTEEKGELRMATEPLDLRDLVAAGGETAWAGVPSGTRMGHLHVHVADLQEAERFYGTEGVGLERRVWSYPGALFLAADGYHHHLGLNVWARSADAAAEGDARLLDWEILLPGWAALEAVHSRLRAQGFGGALSEPDASGAFSARDPWGTAVRFRTGEPG